MEMKAKKKIMTEKDLMAKAKAVKKMETRPNKNTLRRNLWLNLTFQRMEIMQRMRLKVSS
jgi:hypothetical protein